jgi:hypothetical protein
LNFLSHRHHVGLEWLPFLLHPATAALSTLQATTRHAHGRYSPKNTNTDINALGQNERYSDVHVSTLHLMGEIVRKTILFYFSNLYLSTYLLLSPSYIKTTFSNLTIAKVATIPIQ